MTKFSKKLTKIMNVILENDVQDETKDALVHVVSETGSEMMSMKSVDVEGEKMAIVGSLMGAWESTMYVSPDDVVKMIGLLLKPATLGYMAKLPFMLYKRRKDDAEY